MWLQHQVIFSAAAARPAPAVPTVERLLIKSICYTQLAYKFEGIQCGAQTGIKLMAEF